MASFKLSDTNENCQSSKLKWPPNIPVIRYTVIIVYKIIKFIMVAHHIYFEICTTYIALLLTS